MTKFEVTDAMVEAAHLVVDTMARHGSDMNFDADDAMRAAITAAIEASGLVEENIKLRSALKPFIFALARVDPSRLDSDTRFEIRWRSRHGYTAESAFSLQDLINARAAINKEPKND
jgi:hypothetical protein